MFKKMFVRNDWKAVAAQGAEASAERRAQ
jgi:hypothetical protein